MRMLSTLDTNNANEIFLDIFAKESARFDEGGSYPLTPGGGD